MPKRIFTEEHREKLRQAKLLNPVRYWKGKSRPDFSGENHPFFGKPRPEDVVEKISKGNLGKRTGELNNKWKGDNVSYRNIHRWVERQLGKSDTCEKCETSGLTEHRIHWANKSGEYKRNIDDWLRLCSKCHGEYDKEHGYRKRKLLTINK